MAATERTPLVGTPRGHLALDTAFRVRLLTAIASLAEGYDIGIINGALVSMQRDLQLSNMQVGLAVAITVIFSAMAVIASGSLADILGRKLAVGVGSLALVIASVIWALCHDFATLLLARAMLGVGLGIGIATVTIYISEVAPAHSRGFYSSLEDLFLNIGIPLGFIASALLVGYPNDWRIMVGLGAIPAAVVAIAVLTPYFPESPRYLLTVGRTQEAEQVLLELLHGDKEEAGRVMASWRYSTEETCTWGEAWQEFTGGHRKQAIAGFGLGFMQMLGGITVATTFSTMMLTGMGMTERGAINATVVIGILKMMAIVVSAFVLMDRWGRRPLLILSGASMCASSVLMAFVCSQGLGTTWAVIGIILFSAGFSVGIGPATFVYIAEIFGTRVRSKGVSVSLFMSRFVGFFYALLIPVALEVYGVTGIWVFLIFMNVITTVFFIMCCPETKGLTLEQMSSAFEEKTDTLKPPPAG